LTEKHWLTLVQVLTSHPVRTNLGRAALRLPSFIWSTRQELDPEVETRTLVAPNQFASNLKLTFVTWKTDFMEPCPPVRAS